MFGAKRVPKTVVFPVRFPVKFEADAFPCTNKETPGLTLVPIDTLESMYMLFDVPIFDHCDVPLLDPVFIVEFTFTFTDEPPHPPPLNMESITYALTIK
jgi:hypothetical protein